MKNDSLQPIPALVALGITLLIWFVIPVPEGVTPNAWHLLALFIGTIAAIIGKAMSIGALSMIAMALVAITGVTNKTPGGAIADALSGFSNSLIWLIGISIMISRGLIKTGLGARIGYYFIALFGRRTMGIGYALSLSELVLSKVYPPEITNTEDARGFARSKLAELGPVKHSEKILLGVFALLLFLWAGIPEMVMGKAYAVDATAAALLGLALLLLTGVLTWDEILAEKSAWDTVVWFSALVMMATFLNKLGVVGWLSTSLQNGILHLGLSWVWAVALLTLVYLYAHYFFASTTAHITAMFGAFYAAGIALGAPPMAFALLLAGVSSIMMTLTHYATGTSPIIFGSGYTTLGQWWIAGLVMSVVNLVVWVLVGGVWWKVLGYW